MRLILTLTMILMSLTASAETLSGKVIKVLDGDTIDILVQKQTNRIRLGGIDAPEKGMPYGKKSKEFVLDLAAQKIVTVEITETDRYGRSIGEVLLPDGRDLNREIVRAGYAWWYRRYSQDQTLGALEEEARVARRGLWRDPQPQPPWEWRKEKRAGTKRANQ